MLMIFGNYLHDFQFRYYFLSNVRVFFAQNQIMFDLGN
jgi:hypothetical protein